MFTLVLSYHVFSSHLTRPIINTRHNFSLIHVLHSLLRHPPFLLSQFTSHLVGQSFQSSFVFFSSQLNLFLLELRIRVQTLVLFSYLTAYAPLWTHPVSNTISVLQTCRFIPPAVTSLLNAIGLYCNSDFQMSFQNQCVQHRILDSSSHGPPYLS